jgi:hypothetical protein
MWRLREMEQGPEDGQERDVTELMRLVWLEQRV